MRIVKKDLGAGEVRVIPENAEDLWHLERVLGPGDVVTGVSWRSFKVSETDAAEKKKVHLAVQAEKIEFSKHANKLRVFGIIREGTPPEFVQVGAHHTLDVELDYPVSIFKRWQKYQLDRLAQAVKETKRPRVGIVVLDDEKAIFASLRGYGVEYDFEIRSHARKRDEKHADREKEYYGEVMKKLQEHKAGRLIVAGPGFTKEDVGKFIKDRDPGLFKRIVFDSCSYAERAGVNELLKRGVVAKIASEERVARELELMEEFKKAIGKNTGLIAYGKKEVRQAVDYSAVKDLFVIDELLRNDREVEKLLADAEKNKAKITVFSAESDGGKELEGFSGVAALLKFKIA